MKPRFLTTIAASAALLLAAGCDRGADPDADAGAEPTAAAALEAGRDAAADAADAAAADAAAADAAAADATPVAQSAGRFELGTHYERLSPTQRTMTSDATQIEVAEGFWYGCPHCFNAEPFFERWLETKPDYVNFVRLPVTWNEVTRVHARVFYTAEALDKLDEMHTAIFREIHENGGRLLSEEELVAFFGRFDVSPAEFEEAWSSPTVTNVKLGRADEYNRRYKIDSVPTVIVNGKYKTDVGMAGGHEALIELIDELAAIEHTAH